MNPLQALYDLFQKKEQQSGREVRGVIQDAPQPEPTEPQRQPAKQRKPFLDILAFLESSNNPKAQSKTSSAAGLYQYTVDTWNDFNKRMGANYSLEDRFDPVKARKVAEFHVNQNVEMLKGILNREPTYTEKYMAHFMGRTGVQRFLKANPMDTVDKVASPAQLKANRAVFYNKDGKPRKVHEVYEFFKGKIDAVE
jgi:hypothetical protein